jgi:ribosomal protein S18 acetylase RimI-like enzyme
MPIQIKEAEIHNIDEILKMIREFAAFENLSDFCEVNEETLRAALFGETKCAEAILVFEDEKAVGYAIFYPNFASFRGQRGLYLEDLYVKPEYRGSRVGESILKHIAKLAKTRGLERIDFLVLDWNEKAIRFYEKLGAKADAEESHFKFVGEAFMNLAS